MVRVLGEPDTRPIGGLLNADPSGAEFARHIHVFNDPASKHGCNCEHGEDKGIRTVRSDMRHFYDPQWEKRHPPEGGND
jgi:hypothetical protein